MKKCSETHTERLEVAQETVQRERQGEDTCERRQETRMR